MKGSLSQHIVNTVQIIFGGLLVVLMIAKVDFGIEFLTRLKNWDYILYLFGVVFFACIVIKTILKKKFGVEDPLLKMKAAKILIYVSYGVFFLFFIFESDWNGVRPLIAFLAWLLQIIGLIVSFFYKQPGREQNDEIIDDQMMSNEA
jgi:hypothetical protein